MSYRPMSSRLARRTLFLPVAMFFAVACDSASNGPFVTSLAPAVLTSITVTVESGQPGRGHHGTVRRRGP